MINQMTKFTCVLFTVVAAVLSGCGNDVPAVPDPVPEKISVNDQMLTQQQFLEKYCAGKTSNETCVKVSRAMVAGSTRSSTGAPRF
jgi:hypothetical protein